LFTKKAYLFILASLVLVACRYHKPLYPTANNSLQRIDAKLEEQDSSILKLIKPYSDALNREMDEVIAHSNVIMEKGRPQSLLGNFVCDLLLEHKYEVEPDFCFLNYGGLRAPLPKGPIKMRHMYELMPFDNQLVLLKLSESQMIDLAGLIYKIGGEPMGSTRDMRFQYTDSGATFEFGKDMGESYWVLTSDYLLNGGDNYGQLAQAEKIILTGLFIRDVLIEEVKKYNYMTPADPFLDKRCTISE